jgi:hypothetical protein
MAVAESDAAPYENVAAAFGFVAREFFPSGDRDKAL